MKVDCPNCNSSLNVRDEYAGKFGKCKKCKKQFVVPATIALDEVKKKSSMKKNGLYRQVTSGNLACLILAIVNLFLCWMPIIGGRLCLFTFVILAGTFAWYICKYLLTKNIAGFMLMETALMLFALSFGLILVNEYFNAKAVGDIKVKFNQELNR